MGLCGPSLASSTANPPTNIVDVQGFSSSTSLILKGGIPTPNRDFLGNFLESLTQAMLVGTMLVGRLGVSRCLRSNSRPWNLSNSTTQIMSTARLARYMISNCLMCCYAMLWCAICYKTHTIVYYCIILYVYPCCILCIYDCCTIIILHDIIYCVYTIALHYIIEKGHPNVPPTYMHMHTS